MVRLFRLLGADWEQYKALLGVSLRMDFRGSLRGKGRRRNSSILRSMIFYCLMGTTLAAGLISQSTPFMYALFVLTYSMAMMAFAVILEFGNAIVNPDDAEVLLHRPIASRTYFLAKISNLLFFVGLMGTALCLLPSVIGMMIPGVGWQFAPVFFAVSLAANLATAAFIVLIYTSLMRMMPHERFKDILAYLQIGLAMIIVFGYQIIPRMGREVMAVGSELTSSWLYAMPSAWFAGGLKVLSGVGTSMDMRLAVVGVAATAFLVPFSFRKISLEYAGWVADHQVSSETTSFLKKKTFRFRLSGAHGLFSWKKLLPREVRAGYDLAAWMMKRDRSVKTGLFPLLGLPLGALALSIFNGELIDPLAARGSWDWSMSDFTALFAFYASYNLLVSSRYNWNWEGAWVYHAVPLESPGKLYRGVKLSLLMRLMIPFFIVFIGMYCTQIYWLHGLIHGLMVFCLGMVALAGAAFTVKAYPFSEKGWRGNRAQMWTSLLFMVPLVIVLSLIQAYLNGPHGWGLAIALIVLLGMIIERRGTRRLDRVLAEQESLS